MTIYWATHDGKTGTAEDPYEFSMQTAEHAQAQPAAELTPFEQAHKDLNLNQQEKDYYQRHLDNLNGPGGVDNPDGSRSSLFNLGISIDDKYYNIPSVRNGKILPPKDAVDAAIAEGIDKFPSYGSQEEAESRYGKMHDYMEKDTQNYLKNKSEQEQGTSSNPESIKDWSKYPSDIDVGISRGNDLSYGDDAAPYINNIGWDKKATAQMQALTIKEVVDRYNHGKGYSSNNKIDIDPKLSEQLHQAWLASRKIPSAYLGFNIANSSITPDTSLTATDANGAYNPESNTVWYDQTSPNSLVHESIHRGYEEISKSPLFNDERYKKGLKFESSEDVVRAQMFRHFGMIEGGNGPEADRQIERAKRVPQEYLDLVDSIAAKLIASKRGKRAAEINPDDAQVDENQTKLAGMVHDLYTKFTGEPEKWSTKEAVGSFLNQAMSVMGGGYRGPKGPVPPVVRTTPFLERWAKYEEMSSQGKTTKQIVKSTKLDPEEVRDALGRDNLAIAAFNSDNALTQSYFKSLDNLDPSLAKAIKNQVSIKDLKRYTRALPEEQLKEIFEQLPEHVTESFYSGESRRAAINAGLKRKIIPKPDKE